MKDIALEQIRSAILNGELVPNARLRQEELAERLAVSRAPIREAMLVLEREGLIQSDASGGTIVAPLDASVIRDVYEFRGAVERYVAATLAARANLPMQPIRDVLAAGHAAASQGDVVRLIDLDVRFHATLYDAIGNRVLSDVMRAQWVHVRRVMAATLAIAGYPDRVWDEHAAIVEAIEAGDAELAGSRSAAHNTAASVRLIENLGRVQQAVSETAESTDKPRARRARA